MKCINCAYMYNFTRMIIEPCFAFCGFPGMGVIVYEADTDVHSYCKLKFLLTGGI